MVQIQPAQVHSRVLISLLDLNSIPGLDADQNGFLEHDEVLTHRSELEQQILKHFVIRNAGREGTPTVTDFRVLTSGELELKWTHQFPRSLSSVELESTFYRLIDEHHRALCRVDYDSQVEQFLFDSHRTRQRIEIRQDSTGLAERMGRFIQLGTEHIFTGYDHIAFLVGLTLLGGSLGALIRVVSSFTVAHSITLILAALDVVVLPTRFVEAAIALSICYIALENIFARQIKFRWVVAFLFGLVHGFGFSNILREMELPRQGLVTSLLSFNLGVEIGQVMIIVLLFPIILYLSRQRWHNTAVALTSAVILALGGFWFVTRLT